MGASGKERQCAPPPLAAHLEGLWHEQHEREDAERKEDRRAERRRDRHEDGADVLAHVARALARLVRSRLGRCRAVLEYVARNDQAAVLAREIAAAAAVLAGW